MIIKEFTLIKLKEHGLSKAIIDKYSNKLNIINLYFGEEILICEKFNITFNSYCKIKSSFLLFLKFNIKINSFLLELNNIFLNISDLFSTENLIEALRTTFPSITIEEVKDIILSLLENNVILQIKENVLVFSKIYLCTSIESFIFHMDCVLNNEEKSLIFYRYGLNKEKQYRCHSLEEIGLILDLKNGKTRKKEKAILRKLYHSNLEILKMEIDIKEMFRKKFYSFESLLFVLSRYDVNFKLFYLLFNIDIFSYNILNLIIDVYLNYNNVGLTKASQYDLLKNMEDNNLLNYFLSKDNLVINEDGTFFKAKKNILLEKCFLNNETLNSKEIQKIYFEKFSKKIDIRRIENICDAEFPFLSLGNHKYKIINLQLVLDSDVTFIKKTLNQEYGLYSFRYFLNNDFKDICKKLNIFSENELHNFCKKIYKLKDTKEVIFERMPLVLLNFSSKNDFFLKILKQEKIIEANFLHRYLANEYSLNLNYLNANFPKMFSEYYDAGYYKIEIPKIKDTNLLEKIKFFFDSRNIIAKEDIENYFIKNKIDLAFLNSKNIDKLGYRIEKYFLIKNQYTIEQIILDICKSGSYQNKFLAKYGIDDTNYLYKLVRERKIFRISSEIFVPFSLVTSEYFDESILDSLISEIKEFLRTNNFISLNQIHDMYSSKYKFINLFQREWISNLLTSNGIFCCSRKYQLFTLTVKRNILDFLLYCISDYDKIKIADICSLIKPMFNITLDCQELDKIFVNENLGNYYYDKNTEIVFKNKSIFLKEVFDNE